MAQRKKEKTFFLEKISRGNFLFSDKFQKNFSDLISEGDYPPHPNSKKRFKN